MFPLSSRGKLPPGRETCHGINYLPVLSPRWNNYNRIHCATSFRETPWTEEQHFVQPSLYKNGITCCDADTPQWWLQYPENYHSDCPYLEGDKSFPLVLLCCCAVHPLHHRVFNEDWDSPEDERGEEVQVNIIPRAVQMSVKRKNQSWSTICVKAATSHIGLREGTMSPVRNQEVPEEIP